MSDDKMVQFALLFNCANSAATHSSKELEFGVVCSKQIIEKNLRKYPLWFLKEIKKI